MGDFQGHPFRGNQYTANPGSMTGSALTKAQEKVDADYSTLSRELNDAALALGLGNLGHRENRAALAERGHSQAVADERLAKARADQLAAEVEQRAGPGNRRLPHGVGRGPRVRATEAPDFEHLARENRIPANPAAIEFHSEVRRRRLN